MGEVTRCSRNTHSTMQMRGGSPEIYYPELLRVAISDGILFEDFLLDEVELRFTRDIVLPALEEVSARFGLRPLIVHLTSPEEQTLPHWYWYPHELKAYVQERLQDAPVANYNKNEGGNT